MRRRTGCSINAVTLLPFNFPPENTVGALGARLVPPQSIGSGQVLAVRRPSGGGEPPGGALAADQLAAGAAGGSNQRAEDVAARHRAPHLQLLPERAQRRIGAAPELQGESVCIGSVWLLEGTASKTGMNFITACSSAFLQVRTADRSPAIFTGYSPSARPMASTQVVELPSKLHKSSEDQRKRFHHSVVPVDVR